MGNKPGYTPEQVVKILRDIEIEQGKGLSQDDACRKSGITLQTYYRWRKEYGGLQVDQACRLKELELTLRRNSQVTLRTVFTQFYFDLWNLHFWIPDLFLQRDSSNSDFFVLPNLLVSHRTTSSVAILESK